MLRHRDELLTPPHSLRRRHHQQSQHSEAGPPSFDLHSGHVLSGSTNQMLDLSMCRPSQTFSNRFSVLATPPPSTPSFPREFPTANARRTRNSRGTKEAKKRRDMRRNRRKLAAQLLDQQLSQAVDETLTKANFPLPSRSRLLPTISAPVPGLPNTGFPLPQTAYFPPTPPELPLPNFSRFDLSAFSHFTVSPTTPPLRTPTPFRTLPKWCPKIPSLTLGDVWRDCLPTFHDLSSLPEPVETRTVPQNTTPEPCKDLQVWRPIGTGYGRDQSRFFPPRSLLMAEEMESGSSKKVTVKLPSPVSCRLHRSDDSASPFLSTSKFSLTQTAMSDFASSGDTNPASAPIWEQNSLPEVASPCCTNDTANNVAPSLPGPADEVANKPTGTTLCRDLEISRDIKQPANEISMCSNNTGPTTAYAQDWCGPPDHSPSHYNAEQPPYEIDGREIELPYVHANSLTGYSNGQNITETLPSYEELQFLADSGVGLPIMFSSQQRDLVGLNEMVVDCDIIAHAHATTAAGVPLPVSLPVTPPATPPLSPFTDIAAILPIECVTEAEYQNSDAHFHSEQALFDQTPLSPAQNTRLSYEDPNASSINVADFLKLGHAKQCWCGHCSDEHYNPPCDEVEASFSSSTTLADQDCADEDDGSLILSLVLNPSESEPETESDVPELFNLADADGIPARYEDDTVEATEDDGWLLFSHVMTKPAEERLSSGSPLYLPSSPILHLQGEQRGPAPAVIVTPSETSASELSNDYVAVAAPVTSIASSTATNPTGHKQRPRSAGETGLALYENEGIGCVFAKAVEGSWRWGRESEDDWWDWAVEEEC